MAYTEKYFLSFCNPLGQACRISILEDNFIGVSTELVGQADPITVTYDNSDDFKFKPIIESEATINLTFDDETLSFSELWTSDERTFKVEYTIEGVLEWAGFIIPDGFDYVLKGGLYESVLKARDGLATLEGILFKTDDNQFYGFQDFGFNNGPEFPFVLILTEVLRKLDLGIDLWTLVDYYEQTMNLLNTNSRDSDPLAISYVNVKTYVNDTDREDIAYFEDVNEAWDCKKLIENICNIWGSRLYQEKGVWKFKSIHADVAIANSYSTESDPFIGENPTPTGYFWLYEAYYSTTSDINFDNTVNFYSNYQTVSVNDFLYEGDLDPIPQGFYLIKGLNRIIEVSVAGVILSVKSYESAVTDYYWKKYNNTAGYLGRELTNSEITIPCSNKDTFIKENDSTVRMDKVYKQFRVNFDYTFLRVGDSPINLIQNGSFSLPFQQYGQFEAPPNWLRQRRSTDKYLPAGRVIDLPADEIALTNGSTNALEMFIQYGGVLTPKTDRNPSIWAWYAQYDIDMAQKVTAINLRGWVKYKFRVGKFYIFPIFKAILHTTENEFYALENILDDDYDVGWIKITVDENLSDSLAINQAERNSNFFWTRPVMGTRENKAEENDFRWYDFNLRVQPIPRAGKVNFYIHGLSYLSSIASISYPAFKVKYPDGKKMIERTFAVYRTDSVSDKPQFTGIEMTYIPDPEEEVPKTDYIYANGNINYSFQEDPIRIYNGDTEDPEIISGIIVPTNTIGRNKWDTFNNAFGKTDIGMILCKSIMQQYYKPNRLLDVEFKSDTYKYGDIIYLEHIPNVKFIMLRGSFNPKRGYWEDCTLAQISNDSIAPGGIANGSTLNPIWQETGNNRCVKDEDGLNTGIYEYETLDVNSNSESFGDYRWNLGTEDLVSCPIGEPSKYFWGTDVSAYNVDNFKDYTIESEDETTGKVQVSYSNTGGKYIYFLHLASLGSVIQVGNEFQSQIISSFTYLADVTINGYLYRVLRQNFVTSQFDNFLLTYYIQ